MKANKAAILILTLLSIVTTACSSISSMEDKLVGEWQSSGPRSTRLKIAKVGTNTEAFHNGYSSSDEQKQTFTYYWRISNDSEGPILLLQGQGYWDDFSRRTGNSWQSEIRYRIIDLTSDRLVLKSISILAQENGKIETFQRVNLAEERAAQERANEERRKMLTAAPTLLVGSWRDENSLITYGAEGTMIGKYDAGSTTKGTWSIDGDTLTSVADELNGKRLEKPQPHRYQILDLTGEKLVSKGGDGKIWHAVRVK